MTTQPRTIKASNMTPNVWHKNTEVVPPDNRKVLCCDKQGNLWFSFFKNDEWSTSVTPGVFLWQWVSLPLDFMFD